MQPAAEVETAQIGDETLIAVQRRNIEREINQLRSQKAVLTWFVVRH